MIIGHLPSAYILSKLLVKYINKQKHNVKFFIIAGVLGGVAPDFDMLYFYLVDNRQHHHHTYWPHLPVIWFCILGFTVIWYRITTNETWALRGLVFSLGGILHLLLDSIVGDIWWLAPIVNQPYALFTVPAVYEPWWLNFIFHWSFGLEILVVLWAVLLYLSNKSSKHKPNNGVKGIKGKVQTQDFHS